MIVRLPLLIADHDSRSILYIIILYYSKLYALILMITKNVIKTKWRKRRKYPVVSFASLTVRSYFLPPSQYNIIMIRRSEQQLGTNYALRQTDKNLS